MNLNQVTLPAIDIPTSVSFYRKLGFNQIVDSPHYSRFECPEGDSTFSVHVVDDLVANANYVTYFEVRELDRFVEQKTAEGIVFDQLPADMRWQWREARLRDPAGNVLCFFWGGDNRKNPPWRVN